MNLFGTIDLGAYFGTEVRVIDGEEYICIPRRFNPTIQFFGGHPTALFRIMEHAPDQDGFTHAAIPHIPKKLVPGIAAADFVKMTQPAGKFRILGAPSPLNEPQVISPGEGAIDHRTLAANPVGRDDVPL